MKSLLATLSERETEVYNLMVLGLSNPQIAEELAVTYHTAKFHVSNVINKLGVENRTEAVAYGLGQSAGGEAVEENSGAAGGAWDERQIKAAAQRLVELKLGDRKVVNEVVLNLLLVLEGKVK